MTLQNPGYKSDDSLLSKVTRFIEKDEKLNFTLANVSDMARCSILLESYKDAPEFLLKLKSQIPNLTGYISRNATGYKGIHLNFQIDGVNTEVQISTKKAWPVKMAGEYCYAKWRDFNPKALNAEIVDLEKQCKSFQQQLQADPSNTELQQKFQQAKMLLTDKKANLLQQFQEQSIDNELSKDLYEELFSDGDFAAVEDQIEAILCCFESNLHHQQKTPDELFQNFIVDEKGKVDIVHANQVIQSTLAVRERTQGILIGSVNNALNMNNMENVENLIDPEQLLFIKNFMQQYNDALQKGGVTPEIYQQKIGSISWHRYQFATDALTFAMENNLDLTDLNSVLQSFVQECQNNPTQYQLDKYSMNKLLDSLGVKTIEAPNEEKEI